MKASKEEILNRIRTTLRAVAPGARAVLYGSRARGDAREDSDWDILILLDKERVRNEDFDEIAFPIIELGWDLGEIFSPRLYALKEWMRRSFTPFYKNVEQDGIVLV